MCVCVCVCVCTHTRTPSVFFFKHPSSLNPHPSSHIRAFPGGAGYRDNRTVAADALARARNARAGRGQGTEVCK